MRPTVYNKSTKFTHEGTLVAINLGFNFYVEHEGGTLELVQKLNDQAQNNLIHEVVEDGKGTIRSALRIQKILKREIQLLNRWKLTPHSQYVLKPSVPLLVRKIIINNDGLYSKGYTKFLTSNGEYTLLVMDTLGTDYWKNRLNNKRKFKESDFFNMDDYNANMMNNPGYMLNSNRYSECSGVDFAAAWGSHGILILVEKKNDEFYKITENIEKSLKAGNLAVITDEPRLRMGRGCILVNLEEAYMPRIKQSV